MKACLTVEETATVLRLHPNVVRRMLRSNRLKGWGRLFRLPLAQFVEMGFDPEHIEATLAAVPQE